MTLTKLLREMKEDVTVHGFRSAFRDWVSEETNHPGEIAEAALAHRVKDKTEAAYRRGNLLDKRRKLMDERSEEHTSELQSLMRISYAVFCLKKKNKKTN